MRVTLSPGLLAAVLMLSGCASRDGDWPTLTPRPGEISPMVQRNLPGAGPNANRCAASDCAPPAVAVAPAAPDMPPPASPPSPAEARAALATIAKAVADVEAAAAPLRARRDAVQAEAAGAAEGSAATARLEVAQSALLSALAPLEALAYRLAALQAALETAPDGDGFTPDITALSRRIAALSGQ
jgi:hypothetical protein